MKLTMDNGDEYNLKEIMCDSYVVHDIPPDENFVYATEVIPPWKSEDGTVTREEITRVIYPAIRVNLRLYTPVKIEK